MTLDAAAAGAEGPFVIRRRADGAAIGSSRYLNVRRRRPSRRDRLDLAHPERLADAGPTSRRNC